MADLFKVLESLSTQVAEPIIKTLHEVTELRTSMSGGTVEDSPVELHRQLLENRWRIEQIEMKTATLTLLKSRTSQAVADAKNAYTDAYQAAATKSTVSFASDYATAKEKDAHYNLSTLEETMVLRAQEKQHRDIESAWEYCRALLRGAEALQHDLSLRVRLITLSSSLER